MKQYVPLHVHTDGSLLDGLGSVHRLVAYAKEKEFKALAITDHGTLTNIISFSVACKENGIKPILGEEIYITFDDNRVGHLTLLAKNRAGFENIVDMTTIAHSQKSKRPTLSFNALREHAENVICLTGCIASPIHQLEYRDALRYAAQLKEAFGNLLFAETIFFNDEDHYSRVLKIAKALKLDVVVTNDSHFPLESDGKIHNILTTIRANYSFASSQLWLKTRDELYKYIKSITQSNEVSKWLDTSNYIADLIEDIDLQDKPSLPSLHENDDESLTEVIKKALKRDISKLSQEERRLRIQRAKSELSVVRKMGFSSYFLILKDLVDYARSVDVLVGPGRGSGAGSYLLYLLNITELDPIKYGLQFERFLNPMRIGYPDVDVDLDSEGRQKIIEYAEQKYGAKAVATYAHFSHKTLVHDLCRTLHLNRDLEVEAADNGIESEAFKKLKKSSDLFWPAYQAFNDQIRHRGKHAGGIIITSKKVPFERAGDELVVPWTEGGREGSIRELTYAGIVKYDLLGLSALSVLKHLKHVTKREPPKDPDLDQKVLNVFKLGNLSGIFQFSGSEGIRDLTMKVNPTNFVDLIAINALYRPVTLNNGIAWKYSDLKKNPRQVHPAIDDILAETYGVMVFQEQMMSVYSTIVKGSLAEADEARRVLTKDAYERRHADPIWNAKLKKIEEPFFRRGAENGFDSKFLKSIWREIFDHSRYSFNRSHAASYSMVAWRMAWYKTYFPVEFYAASMMFDNVNFQTYLFDAIRDKINVMPPDLNTSTDKFETRGRNIYLPITSVKFMAQRGASAIIEERKRGGVFKSFTDFRERIPRKVVNSRACQSLYAVGGMKIPGKPSDVGIDKHKIPNLDAFALQNLYLGAILPTKSMFEKIESLSRSSDSVVGIVVSKKRKDSNYGPYTVYHVSPKGIFWIRDADNQNGNSVEIGQFLIVKVRPNSGKALNIKKIKIR
jgi:DNA polymerase-3 subunit alpha